MPFAMGGRDRLHHPVSLSRSVVAHPERQRWAHHGYAVSQRGPAKSLDMNRYAVAGARVHYLIRCKAQEKDGGGNFVTGSQKEVGIPPARQSTPAQIRMNLDCKGTGLRTV